MAPPLRDEFRVPDMAIGLYDWVLAYDHLAGRAWLIATGFPQKERAGRERAAARLRWAREVLSGRGDVPLFRGENAVCPVLPLQFDLSGLAGVTSNFERTDYLCAVQRAIDYINAGDCFQVNLSQRLLHRATLSPLELYDRLRRCNPAPFAGYFDLGDFVIASASPERFLRVEDGNVETRPIKGTRPRGSTPEDDERAEARFARLRQGPGRKRHDRRSAAQRSRPGLRLRFGARRSAVPVGELFHVHHLVSEVRGRLRSGLGPVDLLRAAFPGGSVTGAPKVRAMEIIAELEPTARGPYCGSLGYIGFDGSMDTNILIRTFTIGKGWIQFPVGGGIVADSTPEDEYAETLHKAEGLLRALCE